jgi:radical SAM protein with 4Fe4S-binding SPASM domain
MVVFLSWFTSNEIGQQCAEVMKREIGIEAHTWKSYVREFSPELATSFQSALIELKKKSWPFDYFIVPEVGDENYARYYLEPGNFFGFGKCASPFMMTDIMPNGDVVTCRDYVDVKVGNILEDSLIDIWNGDRYVQYRKMMIRNNGKLPQCSRCCGLMGF